MLSPESSNPHFCPQRPEGLSAPSFSSCWWSAPSSGNVRLTIEFIDRVQKFHSAPTSCIGGVPIVMCLVFAWAKASQYVFTKLPRRLVNRYSIKCENIEYPKHLAKVNTLKEEKICVDSNVQKVQNA